MNIKEIINGYLGNTQVNRIYRGFKLVWSKHFDYKYMIGGSFNSPKNKIMRLNNDGSIDNTWSNNSSYTSGSINELIYDNINKKIYAGGDIDGGLIRLNMNGSKDTSFNIGSGFSSGTESIKIDTINQKLYAGGYFTKYNGSTQNRLIRLNMNGSKDTSFNIGTGFGGSVESIIIDNTNSKIYVGGDFTTFQGSTQNYLIRLNMNGSRDTSFNIGSGFNGSVESIIIDNTNSKIYVGGSFTKYNGNTQNRLIRLNMDGSKDTSFNIGTGFGGTIYTLYLDIINQKLYAGGYFSAFQGGGQNKLIRLNMNGSRDTSFNIGGGFNNNVYAINIDTNNQKLYVGGDFTTFNGGTQNRLIRLNMNGSKDTSFNIQLGSDAITILKYTE